MIHRTRFGLTAALLMSVCFTAPLSAQTDMQADDSLSYLVVHQPLVQFFSQLERDTGAQIDATENVMGMIEDMRLEGDLGTVLTQLSQQFDLQWFAFNGVHYVSDRGEARVRLVRLGDVPSDVVKAVLSESGLTSERFPVTDAAQGTAVALTGPPKLLGLSEAVIESITVEPAVLPHGRVIVRRGTNMSVVSFGLNGARETIEAQNAAADAAPESVAENEGDS